MAKCDLCGSTCDPQEMYRLDKSWRVEGVVDLCEQCESQVKDKHLKLLVGVNASLRQWLSSTKAENTTKPGKSPGWIRFIKTWRS